MHYHRFVNPVAIVDGEIGYLNSHIDHFPFTHGVSHWIARHNKFFDMEVINALTKDRGLTATLIQCFSKDPNERRRNLINIFYRTPVRPLFKFSTTSFYAEGFWMDSPALTIVSFNQFASI
jgi:hypothetical protein